MTAVLSHLGIIMDGNGRWAQRRGLPRSLGHKAGLAAAKRIVESARRRGISFLTLYAFSSDNWSRAPSEIDAIFRLFDGYLANEMAALVDHGIRVQVMGRRDRLPHRTQQLVERVEMETVHGQSLLLRLAVDYSARDAIVAAAESLVRNAKSSGCVLPVDRSAFVERLNRAIYSSVVPDIDLVIRTSGEQRLSDFCLWECAYAELYFTKTLWPDFDDASLALAMAEFANRQRRFGGPSPNGHRVGVVS